MTISWTMERESRLQSLVVAGGMSYSAMGRMLDMPRSAVLGKLKRLRDKGVAWVPPKQEVRLGQDVRSAKRLTLGQEACPQRPRRGKGAGPRDAGIARRVQSKRMAAMVSGLPLFDRSLRASSTPEKAIPKSVVMDAPTSLRIPFVERTSVQCAWIDDAIETPTPPKTPKKKAKRKARAMPLFAEIIDDVAEQEAQAKESAVVEPDPVVEPEAVVIPFGVTCCGHPVVGRSYCAHHKLVAYVPDSARGGH
ncbi:GcrA family cell cycle regulator [Methylosinus sp. PW1]|uniref:GcrA family cell cycle regulator n=1 Tax=Methylosinus sp. PW1 TaxID=107636 RepID=UPI0005603B4B|nr:GcrA family cell cycle regulator [Methylosinus sp. PW1]